MRVVTSAVPLVLVLALPVVAAAMSLLLRLVSVPPVVALPVVEVLLPVLGVEPVLATEPLPEVLPLTEPDVVVESVLVEDPVVPVADWSWVLSEATEEPVLVEPVAPVEPVAELLLLEPSVSLLPLVPELLLPVVPEVPDEASALSLVRLVSDEEDELGVEELVGVLELFGVVLAYEESGELLELAVLLPGLVAALFTSVVLLGEELLLAPEL
jgi:hypothetical protein